MAPTNSYGQEMVSVFFAIKWPILVLLQAAAYLDITLQYITIAKNTVNNMNYWTKQKNSIRDAHTQQPGEIVFNNMRYRSSQTVQRSGYFQSSVSYIKLQIK